MPNLTPDTERAIRAFAAYFEINEAEMEFWIKQWRLSNLNQTKPKKNESSNTESYSTTE